MGKKKGKRGRLCAWIRTAKKGILKGEKLEKGNKNR